MVKTLEKWKYEMENNTSFLGRVIEICQIAQIKPNTLRDYWLDSEFGLIYILDKVRKGEISFN